MLLENFARSLDPRQAIQKVFQADFPTAMKQGGFIRCIAAGEDSVIDWDRPVMGKVPQERGARLRGAFLRVPIGSAQIKIVALV
jgi:hypothetical protein